MPARALQLMRWQRLDIADGSLEALKYLAVLLMVGDHVNKYLFNGTIDVLFGTGRIAMPLFVFVLAHNLSRPEALVSGIYGRTMRRLCAFGALATLPFVALGGLWHGFWPLNIMFTLLTITVITYCLAVGTQMSRVGALLVFLIGGSSVEFWWPALRMV